MGVAELLDLRQRLQPRNPILKLPPPHRPSQMSYQIPQRSQRSRMVPMPMRLSLQRWRPYQLIQCMSTWSGALE